MATYYIGANDEHGLNPPTVGKRTPVMPYLNRPIYENEFNRPAKNRFIEACLRNGFRVFDVKPEIQDISIAERVRRVNAQNLTLLATFAYNAFGSGNTFNSANGIETFYSPLSRRAAEGKALSEEVYERLLAGTNQRGRGVSTLDVGMLSSVNCPATLIEAGFMTNLNEAKLMLDPDFQLEIGEETCYGSCNFLGAPYIARSDLTVYPVLKTGSKGNFVMLLQFMLYQYGHSTDIDGVYGPGTTQSVIAFQTENKLTPDGIVGTDTWRTLLFLPPRPTLRIGDRGVYVRYLQSKLLSKLYPLGAADGVFGNSTRSEVEQLQRENGLTADGVVGPATWQAVSVIGGGRT